MNKIKGAVVGFIIGVLYAIIPCLLCGFFGMMCDKLGFHAVADAFGFAQLVTYCTPFYMMWKGFKHG